jgi:DNA-binding HxlR family transcriptional regulator
MREAGRSDCPINLTLELLGDRWSLIVIRDVMFGDRRRFNELLDRSEERIASNVLASRLKRLVEAGLLRRRQDPKHKQKGIYCLTEPAIQLVPVLVQLGAWGRRHTDASPEMSIRAELLEKGGPPLWDAFMSELRLVHLTKPRPRPLARPPTTGEPERPVLGSLQAAFEKAIRRRGR